MFERLGSGAVHRVRLWILPGVEADDARGQAPHLAQWGKAARIVVDVGLIGHVPSTHDSFQTLVWLDSTWVRK